MSSRFLAIFLVVLSFVSLQAYALECYYCPLCADPFSASAATVVTCNSTQTSCEKVVASAVIISTVSRGCSSSCVPMSAGMFGVGASVSCCTTDRCNDSNNLIASKLAVVAVITTALVKLLLLL